MNRKVNVHKLNLKELIIRFRNKIVRKETLKLEVNTLNRTIHRKKRLPEPVNIYNIGEDNAENS